MVMNNGVALKLFSSSAFVWLNKELANKIGVLLESHNIGCFFYMYNTLNWQYFFQLRPF